MSRYTNAARWVALALLILLPSLWTVRQSYRATVIRERQAITAEQLGRRAKDLERAFGIIAGTLDAMEALYTTGAPDDLLLNAEKFELLGRGLHANMRWVRAFEIVTDGVITHVYPLEGNESVVGYHLLDDPRAVIGGDVMRALRSGTITITGPIQLVQGEPGIIVRKRVHAKQDGPARLVALVADLDALLEAVGITNSTLADGFDLALRSTGGEVFFGAAGGFGKDSVQIEVRLPDGAWELGAAPLAGWPAVVRAQTRWFDATAILIALAVCTAVSLTSRRQEALSTTVQEQDAALTEKLVLLNAVIEGVSEAVYVKDTQGRYLLINETAARRVGKSVEDILGRDDLALFDRQSALLVMARERAIVESGVAVSVEETVTAAGVTRTYLSTKGPYRDPSGRILGTVGISHDVTDRKAAQAAVHHAQVHMMRSQRLEALGTLAGGIAHDLNNALAPTVMALGILQADYPDESDLIEVCRNSTARATGMVRQLVTYARGAHGETVRVRVPLLIGEFEGLLRVTFPANIELSVRCEPDTPPVSGDPNQLHQVLLNFCVNARDAMPEGGRLSLHAESFTADAAFCASHPEAKPGLYARVAVHDTGTGIPADILDRVLEPFFSTKSPDKGSGLGLSTVVGIVKGHEGFMTIESLPGKGSRFTIFLPACVPETQNTSVSEVAAIPLGNGETVLFVDDEEAIRTVASAVLERLRYRVLTAGGGAEGLALVAQHHAELGAVIVDIHMPQMDGVEFVRLARSDFPNLPIAAASGRMDERTRDLLRDLGVTVSLHKPFLESELALVVRDLLARA